MVSNYNITYPILGSGKIKALYKRQPFTIVATAFKNGTREVFAYVTAPTIKQVGDKYVSEIKKKKRNSLSFPILVFGMHYCNLLQGRIS